MVNRMEDVKRTMCEGGTTNFVITVQPHLGYAVAVPTKDRNKNSPPPLDDTYEKRVARDLARPSDSPYPHNWSTPDKLVAFSKQFLKGGYSTQSANKNCSSMIADGKQAFLHFMNA